MKIASHNLSQNSSHFLQESYQKEETIRSWVGQTRPDFEANPSQQPIASIIRPEDSLSLSAQALQLNSQTTTSKANNDPLDENVAADPKLLTIRMVLESLTGKKIKIANFNNITASPTEPEFIHSPMESNSQQRVGWGLEYDLSESYSEHEEMLFESKGSIITEDGQKLDFSLSLKMEREFIETNSIQIRAGDALLVDPLVVNFGGTAAELTNTKFQFDLDNDGGPELIPHLKPGSGFLFLDINKDNRATSGIELFGPKTNSGFAELRKYDADQNGWIDENDPVFEKLKIWSKDVAGNDYFSTLSDKDIGAIFLDAEQTEFSLKDQTNASLGEVIATSVFLKEQGGAGTVQEINLVV